MNIFGILRARSEQNRQSLRADLRGFIVAAAQAQLDGREFELEAYNLDVLTAVLEAEGLTPEDFEANVAAHVRRIQDSERAAEIPALKASAERLEMEARAFGEQLLKRYREDLATHREMEFACAAANTAFAAAVGAESNVLAGGEISAEERDLTAQKGAIAERIAAIRHRQSPARPWYLGANLAVAATEFPVIAEADARREIAARNRSAQPDSEVNQRGVAQCKRVIAAAQAELQTMDRELAALTREAEAIDRRLREFAVNRKFTIIRAKRTHANVD